MSSLTPELIERVLQFYQENIGFPVAFARAPHDWDISSMLSNYCDNTCRQCLGSPPIISLGEFNTRLISSGLFVVGLVDVEDINTCPLITRLRTDFKAPPLLSD